MTIDLKANEIVTKAGDVQYFIEAKQIKGKLILTNQRIYFKTQEEDNQEYNLEIQPEEIADLMYFKTKFFIPNGLDIHTKAGRQLRFIVKNRDTWSQAINKMY